MDATSYERAKAIHAGLIKRLYIAGHNPAKGQAVCLEYVDAPPVRHFNCLKRARKVVDRFNRRFGETKKPAGMFEYQGIEYKILSRQDRRWTNSGFATKVYAVSTATGVGGRNFDLDEAGQPYRFSPD